MKRSLILASLMAIALIPVSSRLSAQNSNILYGSSRTPQMNSMNPAFFPSNSRVYVALPSFNLNIESPLSYNSIFNYDSVNQKTYINANSLLDTLSDNGMLRFGSNIHAVGFGFRFGNSFITFSTNAKLDLGFSVPHGLATFLNEGNYYYTGDNYMELLDGQLFSVRAYGEAALGFGYNFGNFTVGARAKMLVGYFDLSSAGSSVKLYTAEDYSSITADVNLQLNNSSAIEVLTDDATGEKTTNINYLPKNFGFNFDLGVRYEDDLFDLSASIVDLGPGIHWTENVKRVVSARENNTFVFTGVDVSSVMSGGTLDSNFTQTLIDSVSKLIEYKSIDGADYWTSIPTKVNLGGMVKIIPGLSAGLLFHGEFEKGLVLVDDVFKTKMVGFYSNTSVLARYNLFDWIEVVGTLSVISSKNHWSWFNPGFGLTLTPFRTLQLYLVMDYISNIYIVDAKQLNLTVGLNLLFGKEQH